MAYRKDQTTVAQTAANNAATVVAALVTAGVISDVDSAKAELESIGADVFARLAPIVVADNEVFAEAEASAPKSAPKSGGSKPASGGKSGGKAITAADARGVELTFGKFKGVTLGELEGMTAEQTGEYGYETGNGLKYMAYLSTNENNDFIAKRALAILEDRKAASDS